MGLQRTLAYAAHGQHPGHPDLGRPWRAWDLDSELRYRPVVEALAELAAPVCEVGSGPAGLAAWTPRPVWGVDPGPDHPHGAVRPPSNLVRLNGSATHIPLADGAASSCVAVDTFEHIPPAFRAAALTEMLRVTAAGGRVIVMGPTAPEAGPGDRMVLERYRALDSDSQVVGWLSEHFENGLPTVAELCAGLDAPRVQSLRVLGVYNLALWKIMHRELLGEFPRPRGSHRIHHLTWTPFGALARRLHRGPYYRYRIVAELAA